MSQSPSALLVLPTHLRCSAIKAGHAIDRVQHAAYRAQAAERMSPRPTLRTLCNAAFAEP